MQGHEDLPKRRSGNCRGPFWTNKIVWRCSRRDNNLTTWPGGDGGRKMRWETALEREKRVNDEINPGSISFPARRPYNTLPTCWEEARFSLARKEGRKQPRPRGGEKAPPPFSSSGIPENLPSRRPLLTGALGDPNGQGLGSRFVRQHGPRKRKKRRKKDVFFSCQEE